MNTMGSFLLTCALLKKVAKCDDNGGFVVIKARAKERPETFFSSRVSFHG